jgi:hypothetical protein
MEVSEYIYIGLPFQCALVFAKSEEQPDLWSIQAAGLCGAASGAETKANRCGGNRKKKKVKHKKSAAERGQWIT